MSLLSFLGRILFNRTTVLLIGLIALGILVWFLGPSISMFGGTPLASVTARVATIVAMTLLLVGLEMLRYWRVRRLNRKMIENLTASQSLTAMTDGTADDELEMLRHRFEEAMAALKDGSVGKHQLYDLPWYLIIGPPGSGKTTILRNSGLQFPLAERLGVEVLEGVGGTRSCDWWLTDQAVLLDTAGRYTTQDINAASDASTWRGFLNILKESRPRQPINGVIIAISLADILEQDEQERKRTVESVKARLQEIMRGFSIRVPVYVLFTKADLVAGFAEFFDDLDEEGREQVWGITLPIAESSTATTALSGLHGRIDGLLERLSSHVPHRLNDERTPDRRRQIYAFPEQLAGIRPLLEGFLEEVFRPNRYSMQPLFRGVYFTSGTQTGRPIDRMQTAYAQAFGFDASRPAAHHGPAKPFFITKLLTDVIIRERGVVGRNRRLERRIVLTYLGVTAACLLLLLALGSWWYGGMQDSIEEVRGFEADLQDIQKGIAAYQANPTLATALPPLDALRRQVDLVDRGGVEEAMDWLDLDADSHIRGPIREAYQRLLRQIALPRIKARLEQVLRLSAQRGDSAATTEMLKLYLGLGDPEKFDKSALDQWITIEFEQAFPLRPDLREAADRHTQALLDNWPGAQSLNQDVIATARRSLLSMPPVEQMYSALENAGERFPAKGLSDVLGLDGQQILVRRSPSRLAPQVPYLYTAEGFYNVFLKTLPLLGQAETGDDWVIGPEAKAASEEELSGLLKQATDRYVRNYIAAWRNFLDDVDIRGMRDLADANSVLATLSGGQSPVNRVLAFVAENTDLPFQAGMLSGAGKLPGALGQAASAAGSAVQTAAGAMTAGGGETGGQFGAAMRWPGTPIGKAFEDIRALVKGNATQAPGMAAVQQEIIAVYGQINAIDTAPDVGKASFDAVRKRLQPANQRDALSQLATVAIAQPEPLRRILGALPGSLWSAMLLEARGFLAEQWRRDVVGECTRAILNRYPVYAEGRDETTIKDFGTFFGPSGTLDAFQTNYLVEFMETSSRPWKNRMVQGDGLNLSAEFLNAMESASVVRSTFFRSGTPAPSVNFGLKPTYLDAQAARIAIDSGSTMITYRHEPPRNFNLIWPDPGGGQQVVVTMTDTNGNSSSIQATGPWSWFRLFDQLKLQKTGLADKFTLPIEIRGRKATFELSADSINNPFALPELNQFRCQSAL